MSEKYSQLSHLLSSDPIPNVLCCTSWHLPLLLHFFLDIFQLVFSVFHLLFNISSRIGPHRVGLVPLWQLWVKLTSHSNLLRLAPARVKSPQPGIKPFSTPLNAHFRAVSYKPVAAICIKMGSFVHEEEYRRNMKSLFPVLTAGTFQRACNTSWKFAVSASASHKHYDRPQWACHKQAEILYLQI